MALTPAQQAQLDELTKLASAADEDDFEVEIFSGDKGARIPHSQAKTWLFKEFGIGEAPTPPAGKPGEGGSAEGGEGEGAVTRAGRKIFGAPRGA
jgi:hypothetical protein